LYAVDIWLHCISQLLKMELLRLFHGLIILLYDQEFKDYKIAACTC
jgi:hypothetical protein